jgi:hypothetical protein
MGGSIWDFAGAAARVERTGLALVHEGEVVLPAAGSEAEASLVMADDRTVINYYFPVEIEVRGAASVRDPRSVIERALLKVASGLENL